MSAWTHPERRQSPAQQRPRVRLGLATETEEEKREEKRGEERRREEKRREKKRREKEKRKREETKTKTKTES